MTFTNDHLRFDAADYLATPEARADYMAAALEEGMPPKSVGRSTPLRVRSA